MQHKWNTFTSGYMKTNTITCYKNYIMSFSSKTNQLRSVSALLVSDMVRFSCRHLICSALLGVCGQSSSMIDKTCPCGTTLECYLWNTWLIGSVFIATASELWPKARVSLALKRPFWLHRLSPVYEPGCTDPLCAFRLTRYNTVIDWSHSYSGLKTRGRLKLCGATIHRPRHARCLSGTVSVNIKPTVTNPWIELMIASQSFSKVCPAWHDDATNWLNLAALVGKWKARVSVMFCTISKQNN